MGRRTSKTRPKAVEVQTRALSALDMRRRGMTFEQIGKALGVSAMQAHRDVTGALVAASEQTRESAAALRELELQRLDAMAAGLADAAENGEPDAVAASLRIMERRARLLGLDAPARSELSGPNGGPVQVSDARSKLLALLARGAATGGAGGGAGGAE